MKIFGADPNFNQNKVEEARRRGKSAQAKEAKSGGSSESAKSSATVAVSGAAKEAGKVSARLRTSPDVRKEKVEEIRERIEKGDYHVSADKIAGKIIEDIIKQEK